MRRGLGVHTFFGGGVRLNIVALDVPVQRRGCPRPRTTHPSALVRRGLLLDTGAPDCLRLVGAAFCKISEKGTFGGVLRYLFVNPPIQKDQDFTNKTWRVARGRSEDEETNPPTAREGGEVGATVKEDSRNRQCPRELRPFPRHPACVERSSRPAIHPQNRLSTSVGARSPSARRSGESSRCRACPLQTTYEGRDPLAYKTRRPQAFQTPHPPSFDV